MINRKYNSASLGLGLVRSVCDGLASGSGKASVTISDCAINVTIKKTCAKLEHKS
ncbi:MAG: hypothetical protein HDT29_04600 [Clostridiales bacterium]|nr:hypothetical protein [Clostridiales bacterium]